LREAFESHEHLAPDLGAVYIGSQELFRKYRRRRRGAQVAGGAVLGAGLLAGANNLPASLLPGAVVSVPPISVATTTPVAVPTSLSQAELARDLTAYDSAGYGYNDAVQLAAIWHTNVNLGYVKAEAGSLLLAGQALPVPPHQDPADTSTPGPDAGAAALTAFYDAGYTSEDAAKLAQLWKMPDPSDAKVAAGRKLEAGQPLPFAPAAAKARAARDEVARQKFWDAGYDVKDAETLGRLWHVSVSQAKVEAGQKLLAGETLPIRP
jgi:hypothetical protein